MRKKHTSKHIRKYGKNFAEIALKLGVSRSTIHNWMADPTKRRAIIRKLRLADRSDMFS